MCESEERLIQRFSGRGYCVKDMRKAETKEERTTVQKRRTITKRYRERRGTFHNTFCEFGDVKKMRIHECQISKLDTTKSLFCCRVSLTIKSSLK